MKKPARIVAVNDVDVKFAIVNGSGSASATELFARTFLRMGIPADRTGRGEPEHPEIAVPEAGRDAAAVKRILSAGAEGP